ncbi:hypothetical protein Tco_1329473 [Tanacetum coccineum]
MSMTIQSSVKDKILATSSETSKVENTPAEMLRDLDQQMEKRADDGKVNVVTDALSRNERVKPRRVRAMAMIIQYGVRGMILAAQSEAFKSHVLWAEIGESSLTGPESSTRTASIRKSDTSVLEDLKALSWKTCQEEQTATGKEISNPFIVDSLLKTIRLSLHLVIATKH